jgi:hypothetical protein
VARSRLDQLPHLLQDPASTTVRRRDAGLIVPDGPFAETKEQIAGFAVIECDDLGEAIGFAARIPAVEHGAIEIRPAWES